MSNFSFSYSIFYPFEKLSSIFIRFEIVILQTLSVWKSVKFVVWEKVKIKSKQATRFFHVFSPSVFKTLSEKEKLLRRPNEQFLLFPECFLPLRGTSCHFHQIENCRLHILSILKNQIFVVREGVQMFGECRPI